LWKEDGTEWPKLLTRVPNPIPFCPIWENDEFRVGEKERFISSRISKYIEFCTFVPTPYFSLPSSFPSLFPLIISSYFFVFCFLFCVALFEVFVISFF